MSPVKLVTLALNKSIWRRWEATLTRSLEGWVLRPCRMESMEYGILQHRSGRQEGAGKWGATGAWTVSLSLSGIKDAHPREWWNLIERMLTLMSGTAWQIPHLSQLFVLGLQKIHEHSPSFYSSAVIEEQQCLSHLIRTLWCNVFEIIHQSYLISSNIPVNFFSPQNKSNLSFPMNSPISLPKISIWSIFRIEQNRPHSFGLCL